MDPLFRQLPLGFFYLGYVYSLLGGGTTYYLGVYGYGSDITKGEERAARLGWCFFLSNCNLYQNIPNLNRLGRFDAVETFGYLVGTALSAQVEKLGGPFLNFWIGLWLNAMALAYLFYYVEDIEMPPVKDTWKSDRKYKVDHSSPFLLHLRSHQTAWYYR